MWRSPFDYLTDAVLRGPTIGCMLMCFTASLVGVIVFLRKESLLGESLSHAAYPGIILGVSIAGSLGSLVSETALTTLLLCTAFCSTFIGLKIISWLENHFSIKGDSALTLVLACFMGIGITMASRVQFTHPALYRQAQNYLFGQAATMTDQHIVMYGLLSTITLLSIFIFYKELKAVTFDRSFAKSIGLQVALIDYLMFVLIVFAVVLGIRSVGVVLMSAMFITPPITARQWTSRFSLMLIYAGLVGLIGGFLGNYLAVEISDWLKQKLLYQRIALPTGPMIVIVSSLLCILSLLFAPKRGLLIRLSRISKFRYRCASENVLKSLWRLTPHKAVAIYHIAEHQHLPYVYLHFILWRLQAHGWIERNKTLYQLTPDGKNRAAQIVRLHRLWELYLADQLGQGIERVHCNAEEIEHILTPDLEQQLTQLLKNPTSDPHDQPIPPRPCL